MWSEPSPNEAAVIRLIGSLLADTHDEWATDERRYLSEESMAKMGATDHDDPVALTKGYRSAPRIASKPTTPRDSYSDLGAACATAHSCARSSDYACIS